MRARLPDDKRRQKAKHTTATRVIVMTICFILHTEFGFGPKRLKRVLEKTQQHIKQHSDSYDWIDTLEKWCDTQQLEIR